MTTKEIKDKIEELESKKFYLAMKDRWDAEDYQYDRELFREIQELKAMLPKEPKPFIEREPEEWELEIWSEPKEVIEFGMKIKRQTFLGYKTVEEWKAEQRAKAGA